MMADAPHAFHSSIEASAPFLACRNARLAVPIADIGVAAVAEPKARGRSKRKDNISAEEKLYQTLRKLDPEVRRTMLRHGLSQEQRLSLESWMQRQKAVESHVERTLQAAVSQGPISWNHWQHMKAAGGCRLYKDKGETRKGRREEVMKWRTMNEGVHGPQGRRRKSCLGVLRRSTCRAQLGPRSAPKHNRCRAWRGALEGNDKPHGGVSCRLRAGGTPYYQASLQAGPFTLRARQATSVHQAHAYLDVLRSIRRRMLAGSATEPIEDRFRLSLQEALVGEEIGLAFRGNIGARHWIGHGLSTPWYQVRCGSKWCDAADSPLYVGIDAWRRLARTREALPNRGLHGCSAERVEDVWQQLQKTFIEIWVQAGMPADKVASRLQTLRAKHAAMRRRNVAKVQSCSSRTNTADDTTTPPGRSGPEQQDAVSLVWALDTSYSMEL